MKILLSLLLLCCLVPLKLMPQRQVSESQAKEVWAKVLPEKKLAELGPIISKPETCFAQVPIFGLSEEEIISLFDIHNFEGAYVDWSKKNPRWLNFQSCTNLSEIDFYEQELFVNEINGQIAKINEILEILILNKYLEILEKTEKEIVWTGNVDNDFIGPGNIQLMTCFFVRLYKERINGKIGVIVISLIPSRDLIPDVLGDEFITYSIEGMNYNFFQIFSQGDRVFEKDKLYSWKNMPMIIK